MSCSCGRMALMNRTWHAEELSEGRESKISPSIGVISPIFSQVLIISVVVLRAIKLATECRQSDSNGF